MIVEQPRLLSLLIIFILGLKHAKESYGSFAGMLVIDDAATKLGGSSKSKC